MQSVQQAQRVLSSAGCSTSGSSAQYHASQTGQLLLRSDSLSTCHHSCGLQNHIQRKTCTFQHHKMPSRRRKSKRQSPLQAIPLSVTADGNIPLSTESLVITKFVAETCLPTRTGKYRVRAYTHSVSCSVVSNTCRLLLRCSQRMQHITIWSLQIDGGRTFSEPTCIMTGRPEGLENVSDATARVCSVPVSALIMYNASHVCLHIAGGSAST